MKYILGTLICLIPWLAAAQSDQVSLANSYTQKADSLFENADYQASTTLYDKASSIYKTAEKWEGYSHCQNKIAENLARQGDFDKAAALVEQTLQFIEQKIGKGSIEEANAYNALGLVELNKGRDDLALENFEKGLSLLKKLSENETLDIAQSYAYLGLVYWDSDNDELALDYQRKALAIRKKLLGEKHPKVAASYNDIGLIYADKDLETALKYFLDALLTYEEAYGEAHPKVANTYINLANIYRQQSKYNVALNNFQKALDIWENVYNKQHPNVGFVLNFMGQTYADQQYWEQALKFNNEALEIYKKNYGEKHPKIANIYNQIGSIYGGKQEYKQALTYFQKALVANIPSYDETDYYALPKLDNYYNPTLLLTTLQLKARGLESLHFGKTLRFRDLKASLDHFEACDQLIAKIRQTRSSKKDKIALGAVAAEIYEEAIRIALAMSEVTLKEKYFQQKAFEFAEKSKAAVLLSAISDTEAKQFANIPKNLLEEEKELKSEISSLEQKLAQAKNAQEEEDLRAKLFEFNGQHVTFIKNLESKFPDYYNLKYNVATATVEDIQKVLDEETLVVSYFISNKDNRLYAFWIANNSFWVINQEKEESFEKYQIGIQNSIIYQVDNLYTTVASELYTQLFPKRIPNKAKRLVIIPDGSLGMLPFEALLTEKVNIEESPSPTDWPYFIKEIAISYNFSATLFVQAQSQKTINNGGLFICGPVQFNTEEKQLRPSLPDLPGTAEEMKMIAELFSESSLTTKVYAREKAQESLVKSDELKKYKYLHFPTHGVVDQEHPELSKIFLAVPNDANQDGDLHAGEIYNLDIDADLVCLSACQTGLGKISKGEGIIGLSRALVYAGANNLIVSYWTVSDESTVQLMTDFYKELKAKGNDNYTHFLRASKLKMIQTPQYAQPYYWAPFVLIGR